MKRTLLNLVNKIQKISKKLFFFGNFSIEKIGDYYFWILKNIL